MLHGVYPQGWPLPVPFPEVGGLRPPGVCSAYVNRRTERNPFGAHTHEMAKRPRIGCNQLKFKHSSLNDERAAQARMLRRPFRSEEG